MQLGLNPNDCILLPEYICDVVLHPLDQLNLKYRYYPVNDALEPRWRKLPSLVDNNTCAIMMVHYFGQPQDISAFQLFCNKYKLLLLEDNAHGHGGMLNGKLFGTFGDMGFSSPRKILNIYSGGMLWLNNKNYIHEVDLMPNPVSISQRVKRNLFNLSPVLKNLIKKIFKTQPNYQNPKAFREPVILDFDIDKWSANIISQTDWGKLRKVRQADYKKWQYFALNNNLTPVFEKLHPEANPWCFPAYAQDQQEAIKWFNWGWKRNQHVFSWPSLPEEVIVKNGELMKRWRKLVCFEISSEKELLGNT